MTSYGIVEAGHHWFRLWLDVCSVPSHYLNEWWIIIKPLNLSMTSQNFGSFVFVSCSKLMKNSSTAGHNESHPVILKIIKLIHFFDRGFEKSCAPNQNETTSHGVPPPVMEDHLLWETTSLCGLLRQVTLSLFNCCMIQTSSVVNQTYICTVTYTIRSFIHKQNSFVLTHSPLRDFHVTIIMKSSDIFQQLICWTVPVKLPLSECHRNPLMISQHWLR